MPVDAALSVLADSIESEGAWPRPSCPNCKSGFIRFSDPQTTESYESRRERNNEAWDPEWIHGTFTVDGTCENHECQLSVHGTGDYRVDWSSRTQDFDTHGPLYSEYFKLTHLHPPMMIMPIPKTAPEEVKAGVLRASRVLFADPGLAATALRATVERFLTSEGVASEVNGSFRTAHQRIAEWLGTDIGRESTGRLLLAVKWLGNAGTHEDADLTTTEVLEGAMMLDEAFHRVYTGPDIDARAQTINLAKGPSRTP
jgi:hypothetical protein